uniref:RNA-directed RNA polymerase 2a n=1 Tax=Cowpea chlorotic mottle virus TaxID=12303 RepID=A0A7S5F4X3_CCMV|nr:2a protein [Cowpea chlorotic mottle virus]
MSKFIPEGETYHIPSFQWMFDQTLKTDPIREEAVFIAEPVDECEVDTSVEITADGTFTSFMQAVKPVKDAGGLNPPFDQARWSLCCKNVVDVYDGLLGYRLIPMAEAARMLYLEIDGSFVDESECDDWRPVDTSDGVTEAFWDVMSETPVEENKHTCALDLEAESRCVPETSELVPSEFTLADRYVTTREEFASTDTDYDISLNLVSPVEHRVGVCEDTYRHSEVTDPVMPLFQDRVNLKYLEAAGHHMLPTHAYFDDTYYQALEELGDYNVDISKVSIRQSDVDWYKDPDKYYEPELNVGSFQRRIGTQKTVLTALKKRNADVPELADSVDIRRVACEVAEKFKRAYLNRSGEGLLGQAMDVMSRGLEYHRKWKDHKDLTGVTVLSEINLQRYQHMIKSDIKPVVSDTLHLERAVAATITFHGKGVTSCFSPYFTACFEKFSKALKSRFVVPIGKISSLELKNVPLSGRWFLEADLSKFDKSQGELHLEFQREILMSLGFPAPLTNWWCDFHRESMLTDPHAGVNMPVSFQRRTGDAFTYFGNTLVTMAMMAYCYDMSTVECAIFSGDDSLLICGSKPHLDADIFQSLFNMEIKVMDPSLPYVCSKFLLETESHNLVSVPDPMREIQRMAKRKIIKSPELLRAHFESFCDRMKFLNKLDEKMICLLCKFVALKYKKPDIEHDVRIAIAAFGYYSENFLRFCECYATEGVNIYKVKHPITQEVFEASRDKDGDWFHDWRNSKFPTNLDKIWRLFGKYAKDDPMVGLEERDRNHRLNRAMNASLKLAYDRRRLSKDKETVAWVRKALSK